MTTLFVPISQHHQYITHVAHDHIVTSVQKAIVSIVNVPTLANTVSPELYMKSVLVASSLTVQSITTVDTDIFIELLFSVVHSKSPSSVIPTGSFVVIVDSSGVIVVDPPHALAISAMIAEYGISSKSQDAVFILIISVGANAPVVVTGFNTSFPVVSSITLWYPMAYPFASNAFAERNSLASVITPPVILARGI